MGAFCSERSVLSQSMQLICHNDDMVYASELRWMHLPLGIKWQQLAAFFQDHQRSHTLIHSDRIMISHKSFKLAFVAALSMTSTVASLQRMSDCGWLGCGIAQQQKPLHSFSRGHSGFDASEFSPANMVEAINTLTAKTQ